MTVAVKKTVRMWISINTS